MQNNNKKSKNSLSYNLIIAVIFALILITDVIVYFSYTLFQLFFLSGVWFSINWVYTILIYNLNIAIYFFEIINIYLHIQLRSLQYTITLQQRCKTLLSLIFWIFLLIAVSRPIIQRYSQLSCQLKVIWCKRQFLHCRNWSLKWILIVSHTFN